jgi:hypothetical protein
VQSKQDLKSFQPLPANLILVYCNWAKWQVLLLGGARRGLKPQQQQRQQQQQQQQQQCKK